MISNNLHSNHPEMSIIIGESHVESVFIANIEPAEDPSIDWERVTEHIFAEKMIDV